MLYDDIDVNIVDSKDDFGVEKPIDPFKNIYPDSDVTKSTKNVHRSFIKKEYSGGGLDTKFYSKLFKKNKNETDFSMTENNDISEKMYDKKLEQKHTVTNYSVSADFKYEKAVTFQEKLSILEERDRYLRETIFKNDSKNMNIIVNGTCPDMCPEKERLLREINCSFSIFEGQIVDNEMHVVPELLVKEYSRSSADQDEPLPHELRPEPVLMDTMSHILINIVPKIEDNLVDLSEWYHFCWDRLRSLRKDIIQQQLCSTNIVKLLEQSARFHICCADRLLGADRKIFDEKINAENLVNCLQMLINMYEDLETRGINCDNEQEFRIYMMLLLLDSGEVPDVIHWNEKKLKHLVSEAIDIFFAFKHKLYTRFFRLVKKTSYLNACVLQRYFSTVKTQILNILVNCYSSSRKASKFPLELIRKILEFDSDEETIAFVEEHGFTVTETREIRAVKSSFAIPDRKISCKSSYILRNKRIPMLDAITKGSDVISRGAISKVHSSFDKFDVLKKNAWNADDQKERVIELYGDIYVQIDDERSNEAGFKNAEKSHQFNSPMENKCGFSFQTEHELKNKTVFVDDTPQINESLNNANSVSEIVNGEVKKQDREKIENISSPIRFQPNNTIFNFSNIFNFNKIQRDVQPEIVKPVNEDMMVENVKNYIHESGGAFTENIVSEDKVTANLLEEKMDTFVDESKSKNSLMHGVSEPIINRKSDDVAHSLTNALTEFQRLYSSYFYIDDDKKHENKNLRKIVKQRLKTGNAKKYARLWKQKVTNLKKNRENFFGVVHLGPEEYFKLWGIVHKSQTSIPRNIIKEINENQNTVQWSSNFLSSKKITVNYLGDKFVDTIVVNVRSLSAKLKQKIPVICWKTLFSLPNHNDESFHSFVSKVTEFYRVLYYKDRANLNSIQVNFASGVKVCTSIDLKIGVVDSEKELLGITSVIMYVYEKWETLDECIKRLFSVCDEIYQVYVYIVSSYECPYKTDIAASMTVLQKKKRIIGWSFVKWKNFFTLSKVMFATCRHIPRMPYYEAKSLTTFMEIVGGDFFVNLFCLWNDTFENSPVACIKLCNKFLSKLKLVLCEESLQKYNLSPEYLPHIAGVEDSQNNLTDPDLIASLVSKYALISFTKWPPKSTYKLVKLLKKYCNELDTDGTLLPNVLRLVNPQDDASVDVVSSTAPWLKIVELWFKYNLYYVSKCNNVDSIFVFYDESKVKDIIEASWIYDRN